MRAPPRPGHARLLASLLGAPVAAAPSAGVAGQSDTFTLASAVAAPALAGGLALRVEDRPGLGQMAIGVGSGVAVAWGLRAGTDDSQFPAVATASTAGTGMALQQRYGWQIAWPFHAIAGTVAIAQQQQQGWASALTGGGIGLATSLVSVERFPLNVTYAARPSPQGRHRQLAVSVPLGG